MTERVSIHGQWSSRLIFVLAATGSAVGLGNIWKFPYIAGENGGGAFVLVYLFCIALVGIPVMMAEILLGRRGRQSPINTMRDLADEQGASHFWSWIGWGGVVAGFLILSYYSVIAGWALAYVFKAASGAFGAGTADEVSGLFSAMIGSWEVLLGWHSIFMVMTMWVVARGVRGGLEKAVTFLMPALLVLLLIMVGYAMSEGQFAQGVEFLFRPDFGKVFYECQAVGGVESCTFTGAPFLIALGHAFFTLSLGMGAIMVYGSYMPQGASIPGAVLIIAIADTAVALLAGMAIFPIVFSNGLEPRVWPRTHLPDPAHRLRRHAGRAVLRHSVFRPSGVGGLVLVHLHNRTGGGLAGREQGLESRAGRRVEWARRLAARDWARCSPSICGRATAISYSAKDRLRPPGLSGGQHHAAPGWTGYGRFRRLGRIAGHVEVRAAVGRGGLQPVVGRDALRGAAGRAGDLPPRRWGVLIGGR